MSWLTLSARLIAKSLPEDRARELNLLPPSLPAARKSKRMVQEQMSTVIWTTPLGLPVVQPYRRERRKQVSLDGSVMLLELLTKVLDCDLFAERLPE
jgi:DNA-directed RNA polymerase